MPRPFSNASNKLLSLLLAGFFFACSSGGKSKAQTESAPASETATYPEDSVIHLPAFDFYLPPSLPDTGTLSLILFLDPQGEGRVPLHLYASGAKERKLAMAASNLCRNGLPMDEAIRLGLEFFHQASGLFPQRQLRVFLTGFSGGAVLASALCHKLPEIKGLIYAAAPGIKIPECPAIGITGMADPNYHEMVAVQERIPQSTPHCLRYWKGKHAWPPPECMAFAFDWIKATEMKGNPASEMVRKNRRKCSAKMTAAQKEEALQAGWFLSSTLNLPGKDSLSLALWRKSADYRKFRENKLREIKTEAEKKQLYRGAFSQQNLSWWKQEAGKLQKAGPENWKEQRLLGYLSLLAWSYSTQALQQGSPDEAQKFIEIYGLVDPENPEPWYLESVFHARNGNRRLAEQALQKALKLGFSDKIRLLAQPEFSGMRFDQLLPD